MDPFNIPVPEVELGRGGHVNYIRYRTRDNQATSKSRERAMVQHCTVRHYFASLFELGFGLVHN